MKAAVIGVGRMGRRHVKVAQSLGLEIAGVCDVSEDSLAAAAAEASLPKVALYRDVGALLSGARPDVVIVATTGPTHAEYTIRAAESGAQFVLCEKPMATSLADCDRMIATCARRGTALAVNHPMRFMPQYVEAKKLLESEELGGLRSMTAICGNFGLAMNGTHYLEAFRFLTGERPAEIACWMSAERVPNPRGAEFEDRAGTLRVSTASGHRFLLEAAADQGHGLLVVYATPRGRLVNDQLAGSFQLTARKAEHRSAPTTRYDMSSEDRLIPVTPTDAFAPTRAVLSALLERKGAPSGEEGRLAVSTLVAGYVSHERGGLPVRLEDAPTDRAFPWA